VESDPRVPESDVPAVAWWFVSVSDGPELRVMEASSDDVPGEELYERLAAAAHRTGAEGLETTNQ
jgi:hypothetical protein